MAESSNFTLYTSAGPSAGLLVQTNPIPGGRDTPPFHCSIIPPFQSDADRAKRSQFPAGPGGTKDKCAKRTQFGGESCKTNPISEEVLSVKCQVLSRASRASSRRSPPASNFTLRTLPERRLAGTNRAKQSQFRPGAQEWARDAGAGRSHGEQLGKTNPIGPGQNHAKRTQFGPAWAGRRRAKCVEQTQFPSGACVRNKPNSVRGPKERSACSDTSSG
jgi:hypothetical protein